MGHIYDLAMALHIDNSFVKCASDRLGVYLAFINFE